MSIETAARTWGVHPIDWPSPPLSRPRYWQFRERRRLAAMEAVFGHLSNDDLASYWSQVALGQSIYEDAGGYLLRCYRAMLGEQVEPPYSYSSAIRDLVRDGRAALKAEDRDD